MALGVVPSVYDVPLPRLSPPVSAGVNVREVCKGSGRAPRPAQRQSRHSKTQPVMQERGIVLHSRPIPHSTPARPLSTLQTPCPACFVPHPHLHLHLRLHHLCSPSNFHLIHFGTRSAVTKQMLDIKCSFSINKKTTSWPKSKNCKSQIPFRRPQYPKPKIREKNEHYPFPSPSPRPSRGQEAFL